MAIGFMDASLLRRGESGGFIRAIAYCHGRDLIDPRTGSRHDFSGHDDVDRVFVVAPSGAAAWASDAGEVAVRFERAARQYNAQLGRRLWAAIPNELSVAGQDRVADRFAAAIVETWGVVAVGAIHGRRKLSRRGNRNIHLHLNVTNKRPEGEGFSTVIRSMNNFTLFKEWRQLWELVVNEELAREGFAARIDMRSYEERGHNLEPQIHEGDAALREFERTGYSAKIEHNKGVRQRNAQRLAPAKPNGVLQAAMAARPAATAKPRVMRLRKRDADTGSSLQRSPTPLVLSSNEDHGVERTPTIETPIDAVALPPGAIVDAPSPSSALATLVEASAAFLRERRRRKAEERDARARAALVDLRRHVRPLAYAPYGFVDLESAEPSDPVHRHRYRAIADAKVMLKAEFARNRERELQHQSDELAARLGEEQRRRRDLEQQVGREGAGAGLAIDRVAQRHRDGPGR